MELRLEIGPDGSPLDERCIRDMLDVFCVGDPGDITIGVQRQGGSPTMRGIYIPKPRAIYLYSVAIDECQRRGMPVGGNVTVARSRPVAFACVLRHEIQHLNQHLLMGENFRKGGAMFSGRYLGRASEVDARRSVDESFDHICAMFGEVRVRDPLTDDRDRRLMGLLDCILSDPYESPDGVVISVQDLVDVLRINGLNTPHNLIWMREALSELGARVA